MRVKDKLLSKLRELEALEKQRAEIQERLEEAQSQVKELEDRVVEYIADGVIKGSTAGGKLSNAQRKLEKARNEVGNFQIALKGLHVREEKLREEAKELRDLYLREVLGDLQAVAIQYAKEVGQLAEAYARAWEAFWAAWNVAYFILNCVAEREDISRERLVHKDLRGAYQDWAWLRQTTPTVITIDLKDPDGALKRVKGIGREAWKKVKETTGVDPVPFFSGVGELGSIENPSNYHRYLAKLLGLPVSLFEDFKGPALVV